MTPSHHRQSPATQTPGPGTPPLTRLTRLTRRIDMLLLLACTPAAGAKGGATRFPGKTTSWRHADAAARMWAESGDHRFSFSELGDSPQGHKAPWTAAATREKRKHGAHPPGMQGRAKKDNKQESKGM